MPISSTITTYYQAVGALGGTDQITNSMVTPANSNAPPPSAASLQVGNNTIVVPSGFTCTSAMLRPPGNSSNVKSVKSVTGDSNDGLWTNQPVVRPVTSGGSFVINSTGVETIEINWS